MGKRTVLMQFLYSTETHVFRHTFKHVRVCITLFLDNKYNAVSQLISNRKIMFFNYYLVKQLYINLQVFLFTLLFLNMQLGTQKIKGKTTDKLLLLD